MSNEDEYTVQRKRVDRLLREATKQHVVTHAEILKENKKLRTQAKEGSSPMDKANYAEGH